MNAIPIDFRHDILHGLRLSGADTEVAVSGHGDRSLVRRYVLAQDPEVVEPLIDELTRRLEDNPDDVELGRILAEAGDTARARQYLLQTLNAKTDQALPEYDWYVVARMAENCDLVSLAERIYARITAPEQPSATSVYAMAQRRLQLLPDSEPTTSRTMPPSFLSVR